MALFNLKKKSEPKACCCDCGEGCCTGEDAPVQSAVKVLGGGCKNCHKLMDNTQEALQSLGMDAQVDLVSDNAAIAAYGVMSTPALVVDGQVVSTGRVLSPEQAADAIKTVRSKG